MKMLDLDLEDLKDLSEITEKEAFEFLKEGEQIVCQTNKRDFRELSNVEELQRILRLKEEEIYSNLRFYIK